MSLHRPSSAVVAATEAGALARALGAAFTKDAARRAAFIHARSATTLDKPLSLLFYPEF